MVTSWAFLTASEEAQFRTYAEDHFPVNYFGRGCDDDTYYDDEFDKDMYAVRSANHAKEQWLEL